MVTKLIPIFTVAGVVAAGSVAYAINAQSLKSVTKSPAGTSTLDLRDKHVIIQPKNPVDVRTVSQNVGNVPAPNSTTGNSQPTSTATPEVQNPSAGNSVKHKLGPAAAPTTVATPDVTIPVLPPAPPGYKPGQGDDGEDDGQDSGDNEDSSNDHSQSEHDDD